MRLNMKLFKLLTVATLFSTSSLYAATITIKAKNNIQWTGEAAYISTNKGGISIYATNLNNKQLENLRTIKKDGCFMIIAKDQSLEKYDGVTSIMQFQNVKKVACK